MTLLLTPAGARSPSPCSPPGPCGARWPAATTGAWWAACGTARECVRVLPGGHVLCACTAASPHLYGTALLAWRAEHQGERFPGADPGAAPPASAPGRRRGPLAAIEAEDEGIAGQWSGRAGPRTPGRRRCCARPRAAVTPRMSTSCNTPTCQRRLTGMTEATTLAAAAADRDPRTGLRAVAALRRLLEQLERAQVRSARHAGWSWQEIAVELGVTRQAVHKKQPGADMFERSPRRPVPPSVPPPAPPRPPEPTRSTSTTWWLRCSRWFLPRAAPDAAAARSSADLAEARRRAACPTSTPGRSQSSASTSTGSWQQLLSRKELGHGALTARPRRSGGRPPAGPGRPGGPRRALRRGPRARRPGTARRDCCWACSRSEPTASPADVLAARGVTLATLIAALETRAAGRHGAAPGRHDRPHARPHGVPVTVVPGASGGSAQRSRAGWPAPVTTWCSVAPVPGRRRARGGPGACSGCAQLRARRTSPTRRRRGLVDAAGRARAADRARRQRRTHRAPRRSRRHPGRRPAPRRRRQSRRRPALPAAGGAGHGDVPGRGRRGDRNHLVVVDHDGSPHEYVHYAAAKAGVEVATLGLARELAQDGVRVNCVAPGLVDTGIHAGAGDPSGRRGWRRRSRCAAPASPTRSPPRSRGS